MKSIVIVTVLVATGAIFGAVPQAHAATSKALLIVSVQGSIGALAVA